LKHPATLKGRYATWLASHREAMRVAGGFIPRYLAVTND